MTTEERTGMSVLQEEFDLLADEDLLADVESEVWPRNTAYVKMRGRTFKIHVEEIDEPHDWYYEFADLEHFILGVEHFKPRNECEGWLDAYLHNAGANGILREDVMEAGRLAGFHEKTVGRAAKSIGVRYKRQGFGLPARWYRQ